MSANTIARFEQFHRLNPHIYDVLVTLAREWVTRTNNRKCSIKALFERGRWELALTTDSDDEFLLDNIRRSIHG